MADSGHEITDEIIEEIEDRTRRIYSQAQREVSEKVEDYFYRFKVKDDIKRKKLAAGEITSKEYAEWRKGQMLIGDRWKDLKDSIAQDYVNSNGIARSVAYGYAPEVYAINHNYATFQIEHDSMVDTSYTLYNREAVESLLKDDRNLLPYARTNSPKAKLLRDRMDLIWNRQHINTAITQGVIQGESIPQIAKRLQRVTDMNQAAAIRNARTMMTGVENKGRVDGYERLREKGIKLREKWISTLDSRTRHSHRLMHGEYKDERDGLYKNGLEYPGDPDGDPEEVYNCRCTEIAEVEGFTIETPKTSPKLGEMTFEQWLAEKGAPEKVKWWKPEPTGPWTLDRLQNTTWEEFLKTLPPDVREDVERKFRTSQRRTHKEMYGAGRYYEHIVSGKFNDPKLTEYLQEVHKNGTPQLPTKAKKTAPKITYKKFKDGESANKYFGKRPEHSLRKKNREEYDRKTEEFKQSIFGKWYDRLTQKQRDAIYYYTGDDFSGVNGLLRHQMTEKMVKSWNKTMEAGEDGFTIQNMISNIEQAIDQFELKEPIKVYRTCNEKFAQHIDLRVGTRFRDDGFVSSTVINEKVLTGNIFMEINVPSGKGVGAWINPISMAEDEEYEFLLQRGSEFEITSVSTKGDDTIIKVNVIGNERKDWSYATKKEVIERWDKEGLPYDQSTLDKI